MSIDKEFIEQVRDDLDVENLLDDPVGNHDKIMGLTRVSVPAVVHKKFVGKQSPFDDDNNNDGDLPIFTDEQIDVIAAGLAELRMEFQSAIDDATSALRDRIISLEAKVDLLTSLIGADRSKSFQMNETVRKRKLQVK